MPNYIPGNSYRNYKEEPEEPKDSAIKLFLRKVWRRVKSNIDSIVAAFSVVILMSLTIWLITLWIRREEKREELAQKYLKTIEGCLDVKFTKVAPAPDIGFAPGSGCFGKTFIVHFSAISRENKYIEGSICCDDNSCKTIKLYEDK